MQKTQEMWVQSLGWEDPLEKEMVTCFNILALEIHGKSPGGLHYLELDTTEHADFYGNYFHTMKSHK